MIDLREWTHDALLAEAAATVVEDPYAALLPDPPGVPIHRLAQITGWEYRMNAAAKSERLARARQARFGGAERGNTQQAQHAKEETEGHAQEQQGREGQQEETTNMGPQDNEGENAADLQDEQQQSRRVAAVAPVDEEMGEADAAVQPELMETG